MAFFKITSLVLCSFAVLAFVEMGVSLPRKRLRTEYNGGYERSNSQVDSPDYQSETPETNRNPSPYAQRKLICTFNKKNRASYTCKRVRNLRSAELDIATTYEVYQPNTPTEISVVRPYRLEDVLLDIEKQIADESSTKRVILVKRSESSWNTLKENLTEIDELLQNRNDVERTAEDSYMKEVEVFRSDPKKDACKNIINLTNEDVRNKTQTAYWVSCSFGKDNATKVICFEVAVNNDFCKFEVCEQKFDLCNEANSSEIIKQRLCMLECGNSEVCSFSKDNATATETAGMQFVLAVIILVACALITLLFIILTKKSCISLRTENKHDVDTTAL